MKKLIALTTAGPNVAADNMETSTNYMSTTTTAAAGHFRLSH